MQTRKCKDCTECCTAMAIRTFNKPAGVPCEHLTKDGCGIYETRPDECKNFECFFTRGFIPKKLRPDKVGVIFYALPILSGHEIIARDTTKTIKVNKKLKESLRIVTEKLGKQHPLKKVRRLPIADGVKHGN